MALRLFPLILLPVLTGCLLHTRNVSSSKRYPTDYKVGRIYTLQRDAILYETPRESWFREATLDLPRYGLERNVGYVYKSEGDKVVATLPAGTELRFERLVYYYYFESSDLIPIAQITSGPHAGKEVDLHEVSADVTDAEGISWRIGLDPAWLAPTVKD